MTKIPETQGNKKMSRYIQDLVRNEKFMKEFQKLLKLRKEKWGEQKGTYSDWTPEERKKHDRINNELAYLSKEYERLRKRAEKILEDEHFQQQVELAEAYGIDTELIGYIGALQKNDENMLMYYRDEVNMCRIEHIFDENMMPFNPAEEIIHMQPRRKIHYHAYPAAVGIHFRATKRDVLDYIEKFWPWIDPARKTITEAKDLKYRPRKHKQELLDFIWENRQQSAEEIKVLLNKNYPGNGLVYHEIQEILRQEKRRRTQDLT